MNITHEKKKPLSDVLYEFSLEDRPLNAELLEEYVRRHSEHAEALTDFAIDLAVEKLRESCTTEVNEAKISEKTSPAVSKAISLFHNRLHELTQAKSKDVAPVASSASTLNPFATLDTPSFRGLAKALNVTTMFLIKLRDRLIEPATIPFRFLQRLGDTMQLSVDILRAHLAAPIVVQVAGQRYSSEEKPQATKRQTYEEAVKLSNLSEEAQRDLLSL